ncbi:TldD/PmbA family protein [Catenulispora sp. NF23]|uniref:TldD/PmbA family protein n=1 Tax=Catenulispora pinistramenti TaxID=2705254 RepID=UPI001BA9E64B|nr:TldD/PmbA family protein [Catenulispora pinistramenti]MBS2538275.1 TldD/PmbA family protein [Catenulispora pinistramenti]
MSPDTGARTETAERVLEAARTAVGGSADVDVTVEHEHLALTRFANSYIHQNVASDTDTVTLRIHADGRTAVNATTVTDDAGLAALVERTVAAVRLSPADPGWAGLSSRAPLPVASAEPDLATGGAGPEARAEQVKAYVDAVGDLTAAGFYRNRLVVTAYTNSEGQALHGTVVEAAIDGIAKTASSDGASRQASRRMSDLNGAALGARAAAKALASQDPVEIEPGEYEVVLEPTAVSDVLWVLGGYGFNGKSLTEGTSFVRLGEQQFDPSVSLVDDPLSGPAAGPLFDSEGTPRDRLELVRDGVTRAVAHDRRSAREAGVTSTGHAGASSAVEGAEPINVRLEPTVDLTPTEVEGPAADSSVQALVAQVRRGLLVTDHWYTRCLDPRRLVMTGLTRNGVWLIENGEITRPVKNLRFTQSYPEALAPGRVLGIGTHAPAFASKYGAYSAMAPALRLAGWNFTGGASG